MTYAALAGGSFIFLAFIIVFIVVIAGSYYSVKGSGISLTPWSGGDAPGASAPGRAGKDVSQNVNNWTRGTSGKRRRTPYEPAAQAGEAVDSLAAAAPAWRGRVGESDQLAVPVDPARDHVRGPDDALVTLVEYGEYECPYCKEADVVVAGLAERFGDDLRVVVRQFPLRDRHPNAYGAARAAEAAGDQGRFWEMHTALARTKKPLETPLIEKLAEQAGVDVAGLRTTLGGEAVDGRLAEDFESGLRSGVNGTPTFYVNGARYDGDFESEELAGVLETARTDERKAREAAGAL